MKFFNKGKTLMLVAAALMGFNSAFADTALIAWGNCTVGSIEGTTVNNQLTGKDGDDAAGFVLQLTGNTAKTYSSASKINVTLPDGTVGQRTTIKLSNGAQNTLILPEGKVATKITFTSYTNYDTVAKGGWGRTSYWKEVAGVSYTAETTDTTKCWVENKVPVGDPDVISFDLDKVSTITFTNGGEQPCVIISVEYEDAPVEITASLSNVSVAFETTAGYADADTLRYTFDVESNADTLYIAGQCEGSWAEVSYSSVMTGITPGKICPEGVDLEEVVFYAVTPGSHSIAVPVAKTVDVYGMFTAERVAAEAAAWGIALVTTTDGFSYDSIYGQANGTVAIPAAPAAFEATGLAAELVATEGEDADTLVITGTVALNDPALDAETTLYLIGASPAYWMDGLTATNAEAGTQELVENAPEGQVAIGDSYEGVAVKAGALTVKVPVAKVILNEAGITCLRDAFEGNVAFTLCSADVEYGDILKSYNYEIPVSIPAYIATEPEPEPVDPVNPGEYLLYEDFASIEKGDNTTTSGSSTAWTGNDNFPTVTAAYCAGGAVKLGAGSKTGALESRTIDFNGGTLTVEIDVKGWSSVEGTLLVSATGSETQTVEYTALMTDAFETVVATLENVSAQPTLTIATSAKRAFIDCVKVTGTSSDTPEPVTVAAPTITPETGEYTEAQTVTITVAEGLTAYYTIDGTTPTVESTPYEAPFTVEATTTITAIAADAEGNTSEAVAVTITIKTEEPIEPDVIAVSETPTTTTSDEAITSEYAFGAEGTITVSVELPAVGAGVTPQAHGTVVPSGQGSSSDEAIDITLTVTPDEGYALSKLIVTTDAATGAPAIRKAPAAVEAEIIGATQVSDTEYTFSLAPNTNATITAAFAALEEETAGEYNVSFISFVNGNVTADKVTANAGDIVTLTVTPDAGYKLAKNAEGEYIIAGECITKPSTSEGGDINFAPTLPVGVFVTLTDATPADAENFVRIYTFTMPDYDVEVSATFIERPAAPTIAYDQPTRTITITNTEADKGSELYYTIGDGSEISTTEATVEVVIDVNTTVSAYIKRPSDVDPDNPSDVVTETYYVAAQPTIEWVDGVNTFTIKLNGPTETNTADVIVYYTIDGTDPTTASTSVTAETEIPFDKNVTTVKAVALDADGNYSVTAELDVEYAFYLTVGSEWVTFCSPMSFTLPEGLKAYTISSVTYTAGEEGVVELTEQTAVTTGTPMLIYNENYATTTKYRVYADESLETLTGAAEYVGVLEDTKLADGGLYYVLNDGMFVRSHPGTLKKYNCYLDLSSNSAAQAAPVRRFVFKIGAHTTGIDAIQMGEAELEGTWFTLTGARVERPAYPGIYIHNGRKVVVK